MTGSKDDPVASAFFADIQLFIGLFQKRGNVAVEVVFYQSVSQRDGKVFRAAVKDNIPEFLTEYFQCGSRFISVHLWKDQQKFLASPAGDERIGRQLFPKGVGNGFQNNITYIVAVGVIDMFEMVDITQTNADLCFCIPEKRFQIFHGAPPVVKAGQGVRVGLLHQLSVIFDQLPFHLLCGGAEQISDQPQRKENKEGIDDLQGIVQIGVENRDRFVGSTIVIKNQTQYKQEYGVGNFAPLVFIFGEEEKNQKHNQKVLNADIPAEIVDVHNSPEQDAGIQNAV